MRAWGGKGDTSSGGAWGSSGPEVKQRSDPQSWGAVLGESWMLRSPYQPKSPQPSASAHTAPILPSRKPWGEAFFP